MLDEGTVDELVATEEQQSGDSLEQEQIHEGPFPAVLCVFGFHLLSPNGGVEYPG